MSRQRLRQSFIEWKYELSHSSIVQKILYQINEKVNNGRRVQNLTLKISPFLNKFISNNYKNEIVNIEKTRKIKINILEDLSLDNINTIIDDSQNEEKKTKKKLVKKKTKPIPKSKVKKSKIKSKENKSNNDNNITEPILKEIKNKKTGWWQK